MSNKNIAFGIVAPLVGTVVIGFLVGAGSLSEQASGGFYSLFGLCYFIFGIWGAIRLNKI